MSTTTAQSATKADVAEASAGADLKDLKEQYDILKIEMKAMTEMLGTTAKSQAEQVKHKAEDARDDALARMELMGNEARARVDGLQADAERAVISNPVTALAIAAGVGFVLGALTRR